MYRSDISPLSPPPILGMGETKRGVTIIVRKPHGLVVCACTYICMCVNGESIVPVLLVFF